MTEWQVILVIGEVLGLFLLVGNPIIALNSTLVKVLARLDKLDEQQKGQTKATEKLDAKNSEAHKEIYDHLDANDIKLENHETRLQQIERKNN